MVVPTTKTGGCILVVHDREPGEGSPLTAGLADLRVVTLAVAELGAVSALTIGLDLVLVDIGGGQTDPVALCERVRSLTEAPILLVAPSGATDATTLAALRAGADDVLPRERGPLVVRAKVVSTLVRRRRRRERIADAPLAGTCLDGCFHVVEPLGRGGTGAVYLVEQIDTGERYALKILDPRNGLEVDARRRFLREVGVLGSLRHRHIVRIHDAGDLPPLYYLMDYLPGGSLGDRLDRRGPMPASEALALIEKLAGAIQRAHDRGIVHRDLKSENVLFDARGKPVLTDFSLALDLRSSRITDPAFSVGTLRTMAPEQLSRPLLVDERSDVHGLGVILFEALTGEVPFGNESSDARIVRRILEAEVCSPRELDRSIPTQAAKVCSRALARRPRDRYVSAADLGRAARIARQGIELARRAPGAVRRAAGRPPRPSAAG